MISFKNFNEILKSLEVGYTRVQSFWFPQYWTRQTEVEKSKAYRKLTMMVNTDMEEAFKESDREKALSIWTILIESMKIVTAFPEESEADLGRVKGLYDAYEEEYYKDDSEVM